MLVLVNQFVTTTFIRVDIYVETDTASIQVQAYDLNAGVYVTPPGTATELERDAPEGGLIYDNCIGFDRYIIVANLTDPFATITTYTPNSATCGFTTCDIVITGITTQSPSFAGGADGKATVNITSTGPAIEYSLDNINWQSSPVFNGLLSGSYIAYVRDANGCNNNQPFSIPVSINPYPEDTTFPFRDKVCRWFKLKKGAVITAIREPIKWDAIGITGERDTKWHGYNWQYSDGEVQLEFDCDAGKAILDAAFEADGNDAEVELLFGYTKNGDDFQLYQGKFDFNTYKRFASHVSVTVIRKDNMDILQSRFDEKFTVTKDETFGGSAITPLPGTDITLHGKDFKTAFRLEKPVYDSADAGSFTDTSFHLAQFDFTEPSVNEIENSFGTSLNVLAGYDNPYSLDLSQFKLANNGTYQFNITYNFNGIIDNSRTTSLLARDDYRMRFVFAYRREGVVTETILSEKTGTIGANEVQSKNFSGTYTVTLSLQQNDELFLFVSLRNMDTDRRSKGVIQVNNFSYSIDATETQPDSLCKVWWLGDVAKYGLSSTTDNQLRLKSQLIETAGGNFGIDGPFSLYVLTNGYNIRRFIDPVRPLITSLKDLFESVNAITAAGMGLEKIGSEWIVRLEPVTYFYRNVLIIYIPEVESYDEEVAKDLIFNALEFGYEKYEEDGIQQLDEFNTRQEWSTPIKSYKNKLDKKSKLIGGGYTIEKSRRNQFSESSKDTVTNDEDGFIIAVRRTGATVVPEKDEAFTSVTNVISPETSYNLRISPKRMLLNWWNWLKGSFYYKETTEAIRNTFFDRNGDLTTQFLSTEPHPLGDYNRAEIQEKEEVLLSEYGDPAIQPIYRPEWVNVKCRLTPDQVDILNKSMNGSDDQNRNYGYVMVKKPDGNWQAFWVYKVKYSYVSEQCELRGLKKWATPAYPVDECCAWMVANGCYVKANGNRIIP
jgi:hypothetical protein